MIKALMVITMVSGATYEVSSSMEMYITKDHLLRVRAMWQVHVYSTN